MSEVLSAHGIISQNVSRVPGMQNMLGSTELTETGDFDFLNYLLGLQVNSVDGLQGQDALLTVQKPDAESLPESPLQSLFQKKEQPLWNPLVPVGTAVSQTPILAPKLGEGNGADEQKLSGLLDEKGNSQTTQNRSLLENRLLEPAHFLDSKKAGLGSGSALDTTKEITPEANLNKAGNASDAKMSKGIEKYRELSQMQNAKGAPTKESISQTQVSDGANQSRTVTETASQNMFDKKSLERKRDDDSGNTITLLSQSTHTSQVSNGHGIPKMKSIVHEPTTLPEVFKKVESMVHHGGGKMTVELSPPELGKLEIHVVAKGNTVEIKMRSENDFAKATLENHMGELKTAMEGQNLQLHKVEVNVGFDMDRGFQGGQFAAFSGQEGQQAFNQFSGSQRENSHWQATDRGSITAGKSEIGARFSSEARVAATRGGVDIRI